MGGGVSTINEAPDVQVVPMTDRKQFLADCNRFFDTMQGCDGLAARSHIYSVLNGLHQASEILNVFTIYCPEGRMSQSVFIEFLRDVKVLDKSFSAEIAAEVYAAGRLSYYQNQDDAPDDVNFAGFLYHIIPKVAAAKNMDEDALNDKLSRHHRPSPLVNKRILSKRSLSLSPSPVKKGQSKSFFPPTQETSDDKVEEETKHDVQSQAKQDDNGDLHFKQVVQEANPDLDVDAALKHQAALVIQSIFRCRIAKRRALHLKQLKKGKRVKDTPLQTKLKKKDESSLKKVFAYYCPNDDIDLEGFVALIKDAGLLCRKYLSCDSEYNFMEAIAKAELPETPKKYSVGVRFKKRFTFMVFKEIALSFVALSKGTSYDTVVSQILESNKDIIA